ncbi:MAG: ferrous iron transport protein B [Actinomycetota bacterium]|nr:ferrous iron transport protein B [Actinomycetota bacterium]
MNSFRVDYGTDVEAAIERLVPAIADAAEIADRFDARWLAIALIDEDPGLAEQIEQLPGGDGILLLRDQLLADLRSAMGTSAEIAIAGARFQAVNDIVGAVTETTQKRARTRTDRIDAVVTNRFLGIPIFLAAMWVVFKITADVAGAFLEWIDSTVSGPIDHFMRSLVGVVGLGGTWVESLLADGVVAGVGAILVFIPVLFSLYLALAFLEDSGYMARAAFVMDRVMGGVGLQGKSFLPMLVGFGCTVPAVYATRTLENERDRILTTLLVPFMSCGARLPVYVIMASVFFPEYAGVAVFGMYLLGIAVAMVIGFLLKRSVLPVTDPMPAIMEMPPYRLPTFRSIWFHTWTRTRAFLREAGSIIFITTIVVWLLMAIPIGGSGSFGDTDVDESAFSSVAGAIAPVLEPAGFGSWEATGSLMSGFVAKEVIVSTMAQVYGVESIEVVEDPAIVHSVVEIFTGFGTAVVDAVKSIPGIFGIDLTTGGAEKASNGLSASIRVGFEESSGGYGALAALAFMVFILVYTPCMATVGAIRHEIGTRWMWFSVIGQTLLAWVMAVGVFQIGKLMGLG